MTISYNALAVQSNGNGNGNGTATATATTTTNPDPALVAADNTPDPFTYDGHYDASEYDKVFSIDYAVDDGTRTITGGTLAFGNDTDTGEQYIYISHPLGFKDLSYGKNKETDHLYNVGWGDGNGNAKDAKGAVDSEHFTLSFNSDVGDGANSNDAFQVKFDMKVPGTANDDGNTPDVEFLSTLNYNALQVSGALDGDLGQFNDHSPQTVACGVDEDGDNNDGNEESSDPSCYALDASLSENYIDNDMAKDLIDWDFEFGIEIKLSSKLYENLLSLATTDFAYQGYNSGTIDSGALISLDLLHASPAKVDCISASQEPCSAEVVDKPPTEVPEPSTLAIFALALGLLRFQSKRRNA